ncbi:MAG: hypothetical protein SOS93_02180 [Mannheimia varigena]|nr:hypothetical protein [Mannheimia varigena]
MEYLSAHPPSSRLDFSALAAVYFQPYLLHFFTATKHLHLLGNNFSNISLDTVAIRPLPMWT